MTHDGSTQARPLADDPARGMPRLPLWAASLTIETGLLHVIACSDHFREWWGYGVFFLVVALCQIIGGTVLLVKSNRGLYLTGIVGMTVVLAVWAVSRTVGTTACGRSYVVGSPAGWVLVDPDPERRRLSA